MKPKNINILFPVLSSFFALLLSISAKERSCPSPRKAWEKVCILLKEQKTKDVTKFTFDSEADFQSKITSFLTTKTNLPLSFSFDEIDEKEAVFPQSIEIPAGNLESSISLLCEKLGLAWHVDNYCIRFKKKAPRIFFSRTLEIVSPEKLDQSRISTIFFNFGPDRQIVLSKPHCLRIYGTEKEWVNGVAFGLSFANQEKRTTH